MQQSSPLIARPLIVYGVLRVGRRGSSKPKPTRACFLSLLPDYGGNPGIRQLIISLRDLGTDIISGTHARSRLTETGELCFWQRNNGNNNKGQVGGIVKFINKMNSCHNNHKVSCRSFPSCK